jgi:hypothetical protein
MLDNNQKFFSKEELFKHRWDYNDNIIHYDDGLNITEKSNYILVSWLHSGSCFSRELIRENFPECVNLDLWGKTHWKLTDLTLEKYKDCKIFFILSDPRDVAVRVGFIENGQPVNGFKNEFSLEAVNNRYSIEFLEENFNKISELLKFYQNNFGENCLVLKYEDAYLNPLNFVEKVGEFLNLKPLYIDDLRKYKHSIHKEIGIFNFYYSNEIINTHMSLHHEFYRFWKIPYEGYFDRYYVNNGGLEELNYVNLLKKNSIDVDDVEIKKRIKNIENF